MFESNESYRPEVGLTRRRVRLLLPHSRVKRQLPIQERAPLGASCGLFLAIFANEQHSGVDELGV
jgi:hypothetical protein